jgi:hypothetical protein
MKGKENENAGKRRKAERNGTIMHDVEQTSDLE